MENLGPTIFLVNLTQNWEPFPDSPSVGLNSTDRAGVFACRILLREAGVAAIYGGGLPGAGGGAPRSGLASL